MFCCRAAQRNPPLWASLRDLHSNGVSRHQRKPLSFSSLFTNQIPKSPVSPDFVSIRRFSMSPNQPKSFAASYLRDSLGFSERNAVKASKYVHFRSPESPDKVVSVLKGFGFTQTQISDIARRIPDLLVSDTEKAISPVLEFLRAEGISDLDISKMVSVAPKLLKANVDDQIRPSYDFYKELFKSDEKASKVFRRWPHILAHEFVHIAPNVNILRESGVPNSNIAALLENQPRSLIVPVNRFQKIVKEIEEMGYDASKVNYVLAVLARTSMSKATRKSVAAMDFFVNQPCFSEKLPLILGYSMKKRVIPRCSVLHVLLSNGSLKETDLRRRKLLQAPEKKFVRKFISPYTDYRDNSPNVMKLYREKKELAKNSRNTRKK